ncbi:heavy metal translocating P-type ATPase [Bacillus piscicola]|uniref:heavy metal translocating P-type ATPase n=1 Tax=Bacillus piscicola TaxID=1632684 RepID=UPI001F0A0403|nr:heavy metal translocating P-type ATPase [Bacillus piscicola]
MNQQTIALEITGMHCAACAARIEKVVSKMEGVTTVSVNLATEKGRVTFNKSQTSLADILNKIQKIGFHAAPTPSTKEYASAQKQNEIRKLQLSFICAALLSFPLIWAMFAHFTWASFITVPGLFTNPLFQLVLAFPIQFFIGFPFYKSAWSALKNKSANMDVLVVLSTSAAFFYSHYLTFSSIKDPHRFYSLDLFYETSALIITFILLGKVMEAKTKRKTTESMKKLYQLQTNTASLYESGKERKVPITSIVPGNIVLVKPGEKIPIDGYVIEGSSTLDESLLTGESFPVAKTYRDPVYAGTLNHNGLLKVKAVTSDADTALSRVIRIVEDAQASKAPIQRIADQITGWFVPIVVLLAMVTFAAWYTVWEPGEFHEALEHTIAVLIIACPCALGLATPTSIMVGSGRAATRGILFKEGQFIEVLNKSNVVVLDKTGTITEGEPQVTNVYAEHYRESEFLKIIAAAEKGSSHPLAHAILTKAGEKIFTLPEASHVLSMPGYGIKAFVNGKSVIVANARYFHKQKLPLPSHARELIRHLEREGKTVMIATFDDRFAGIVAVSDQVKPASPPAINRLQQMGLEVIMLTGDNEVTAAAIAQKTGIRQVEANRTPQEKAALIQQLQKAGRKVVMVGDGINDAPALTTADIGIALGTGADVAMEAADVTVMKGDLNRVVDAITTSQATTTNMKQNFVWAFLYNMISIPFAALGFLAPWLAGAAMACSSVSVVVNSLRLQKMKLFEENKLFSVERTKRPS